MGSPTLPWLWVIQALASCKEVPISTLQGLIDVSPVAPDDFCEKTRELLALRCLEDIFGSAHRSNCDDASTSLDSRVRFDFSLGCEDVLQQILNEIPLSNLKVAGPELSKWDIFPYIMHKRANSIKCDLEQLKESIFEGTHPYTDYIKSKSGLAFQNEVHSVHVNDGECNDTDFVPSKRSRVDSADEHVVVYPHEKQVHISDCDVFLMNAEKIKCNGSSNGESKEEKPVCPGGKEVVENSTDNFFLVSERGGSHIENNIRENLGEDSLQDRQNRFVTSNRCKSSSNNDVTHDELNIPLSSTVMLQHTSGGKYCQHEAESVPTKVQQPDKIQRMLPESLLGISTTLMPTHTSGDEPCHNTSLDETKDDTGHRVLPTPKNVDDLHKVPNIISESQSKREIDSQLNEPNASSLNVSQQPVVSDKAIGDTVNGCGAELSSDSDEYHNEAIGVEAKKHKFLNSQCKFGQDFSACIEKTGNKFCVMCNKGGKLLVCKTISCPLMVHKTCLGTAVHIDADSNFFCPFCAYCHAISEYLEAKKNASLARKELTRFIHKDIRNQNTKLRHEVHIKERSFLRTSGEHEHIQDKNNANGQFPRTEDKKEDHVGEREVNCLHVERSQLQALTSFANSTCKEKEIENNGYVEGLSEEQRGEMLNLKRSTSQGVEENQMTTELLDGDDDLSCEKTVVLSVNQNNTEKIQQEMQEQHNTVKKGDPVYAHDTDEEDISNDEHETSIFSRYARRFRKRKRPNKS